MWLAPTYWAGCTVGSTNEEERTAGPTSEKTPIYQKRKPKDTDISKEETKRHRYINEEATHTHTHIYIPIYTHRYTLRYTLRYPIDTPRHHTRLLAIAG